MTRLLILVFSASLLAIASASVQAHHSFAVHFDPNGVGADVPSSARKEFTERYRLSDDGQTLMVEYTIADPVYLTGPYTSSTGWSRLAEGTPIEPFERDAETAAQSTSQGAG